MKLVAKSDRNFPSILRKAHDLLEEESLQDTEIKFRPVLHKMICGDFSESKAEHLSLGDVDKEVFVKVLGLWCENMNGQDIPVEGQDMELGEIQQLACVADQLQITEVAAALEETIMKHLSVDMCMEMLAWTGGAGMGMGRLQQRARSMMAERFEQLISTADFVRMDEETLASLLDDDLLNASGEERVWEALVGWMTAEEGQLRGLGLVDKIRFPLMKEEYLRSKVAKLLPAEHAARIEGLAAEALWARAERMDAMSFNAPVLLGPKAFYHRKYVGYMDGGGRRMNACSADIRRVQSVVDCAGFLCCATSRGSIKVFDGTTLQEDRTAWRLDFILKCSDRACALAVCNGLLVSGHCHGDLRLSNVVTGTSRRVVERGRAWEMVQALAICEPRVVSGSSHGTIKVWATVSVPWTCERTLKGGDPLGVLSLAVWQGRVMGGAGDHSIRVWGAGTGALEAALVGHTGRVCALVVHGDLLLSASEDGTIREWAAGAWAALRAVEAHAPASGQYPRSLAVSGSKLISGSSRSVPGGRTEVRVWGLAGLECEHALPQAVDADVTALRAVGGEVWAGVGSRLVVWRRV